MSILKGSRPSLFKSLPQRIKLANPFPEPDGKRARYQGGVLIDCPAGQSVSEQIVIPSGGRWLTGVEYEAFSMNHGDIVTFEVHHSDPQIGMVDEFARDWYVMTKPRKYELYPAWLPEGFIINVAYTNVGASAAKMVLNPFLHLETGQ